MKQKISFIVILILIFMISGCAKSTNLSGKVTMAILDVNGNIIIDQNNITKDANFYSYQKENTKIEIIALKASDGTVRLAFNTCQACNPAKHAYFLQSGNYLVCQNCGTKIFIDDVGVATNGCNPIPILDKDKSFVGDSIVLARDFIESYRSKFINIEKTKKLF